MTDAALSSIEAEQALLGAILYDNAAFLSVDGKVEPGDFHEPVHGRMFRIFGDLIRTGMLADAITVRDSLAIDPAFRELGGFRYLADLVDRAPPSTHAESYAEVVRSHAMRRSVVKITRDIQDRIKDDPRATGADLMASLETQLLSARSGKHDLEMVGFGDAASSVLDRIENPQPARALIRTGLDKIDEITGGCERGDLIVIGARPSMGKSALASCIALNLSKAGLGAAEVNSEMSIDQMTRRHMTDLCFDRWRDEAPTYRDIRRNTLTPRHVEMLREVRNDFALLPLMMRKKSGITLGQLGAMLRRQKMLWAAKGIPLTAVVVDHVGLVLPDDFTGNRAGDQAIISAGLKVMAEDLDVVMFALAQLNRKVEEREDKRPQLADLRDSGTWEQDADCVFGIYRDAYYARREREPKKDLALAEWMQRCSDPTVEAIGLKIREGEIAVAKLWADIGRNAIRDRDPVGELF